jgi:Bacterial RNA polymerase, alpha chain C terminal domain
MGGLTVGHQAAAAPSGDNSPVRYWRTMGLSRRAANRLVAEGFRTVEQLRTAGESALRQIPGLGPRSLDEVMSLLALTAQDDVRLQRRPFQGHVSLAQAKAISALASLQEAMWWGPDQALGHVEAAIQNLDSCLDDLRRLQAFLAAGQIREQLPPPPGS